MQRARAILAELVEINTTDSERGAPRRRVPGSVSDFDRAGERFGASDANLHALVAR
jgi:hypothetical protein